MLELNTCIPSEPEIPHQEKDSTEMHIYFHQKACSRMLVINRQRLKQKFQQNQNGLINYGILIQ